VNLSITQRRVHHIGSGPIVQGGRKIIAHGDYMLLQQMICAL